MITQDDIARRLQISRTTVARALRGKSVSEKTRQLVCEEAKRLGYIQNGAATSLALKSRINIYAFIIATIDEGYGEQMNAGIQEVSNMWYGYNFQVNVIFTDITRDQDQCDVQLRQFRDVLRSHSVDGVIFCALSEKNMQVVGKECAKRGIPLMTLDMLYKNNSLCHVGPDYYSLGTYSAAYIASLMMYQGKILTLSYDEGYELSVKRMEGFHRKLDTYTGIQYLDVRLPAMNCESYRHALEQHLESYGPVTVYAPYHVDFIGKYLNEKNLQGKIILVSNAINDQIEQYLSDGTIQGIVSARPYFLGAVVANNFFKYFYRRDEMLTGEIDVACDIYIKENYNRFDKIF